MTFPNASDCSHCHSRQARGGSYGTLCDRCYRRCPELRQRPSGRSANRWLRKDLDTLARMYAEGETLAQISSVLGRSPRQLQARAYALGLRRGRAFRANPDEVRELWQDGLTDTEAARELGVTPGAIFATRRRLGLRTRYTPGTPRCVAVSLQARFQAAQDRWPGCAITHGEGRVLDALERLGGEADRPAIIYEAGYRATPSWASLKAKGLVVRTQGHNCHQPARWALAGAAAEAARIRAAAKEDVE